MNNLSGISEDRRQFASDNNGGICPEAWEAMQDANHGHASAYGDDRWTEQASDAIRELFETDCQVFFTFNGTAANSLALASLCQSYHSVISYELAHIETDECGGPEFFSNGTKLLLVPGEHGKINLPAVEEMVRRRKDIHFPKPRVLSVTQATEMGTVYSVDELRAIHDVAQRLGLSLHMDGARFANAVASLGVPPKEITWKAGIDVLCFGGTKNGMAVGECVIFFCADLAEEFAYRCKQAGQLASKMRFLAAPWARLLKGDVWLKNARKANHTAKLLETKIKAIQGVDIVSPVESNAVFVRFRSHVVQGLQDKGWKFYDFIGDGGIRLMCSWDTTEEDVESLVRDIQLICDAKPLVEE